MSLEPKKHRFTKLRLTNIDPVTDPANLTPGEQKAGIGVPVLKTNAPLGGGKHDFPPELTKKLAPGPNDGDDLLKTVDRLIMAARAALDLHRANVRAESGGTEEDCWGYFCATKISPDYIILATIWRDPLGPDYLTYRLTYTQTDGGGFTFPLIEQLRVELVVVDTVAKLSGEKGEVPAELTLTAKSALIENTSVLSVTRPLAGEGLQLVRKLADDLQLSSDEENFLLARQADFSKTGEADLLHRVLGSEAGIAWGQTIKNKRHGAEDDMELDIKVAVGETHVTSKLAKGGVFSLGSVPCCKNNDGKLEVLEGFELKDGVVCKSVAPAATQAQPVLSPSEVLIQAAKSQGLSVMFKPDGTAALVPPTPAAVEAPVQTAKSNADLQAELDRLNAEVLTMKQAGTGSQVNGGGNPADAAPPATPVKTEKSHRRDFGFMSSALLPGLVGRQPLPASET